MKVLVPLAEGFEEIEAVSIIDTLRRGDVEVITASLGDLSVKGSHDIIISCDVKLESIDIHEIDSIVLPGGMPGSRSLQQNSLLAEYIAEVSRRGGVLGAICAAPIVLGSQGLLQDRTATSYPGFENELTGASYAEKPVVVDGNIVTARGPGCAIPFALELLKMYKSQKDSDAVKTAMQVYWM